MGSSRFSGGLAYPNEHITLLSGEALLKGKVEAPNKAADAIR